MRQQVKRVVAIIMTVAMLVGLFPLEVFAQNSQRAADTQTLTASVDYDSAERATATVTYHKEAQTAPACNIVFLLDASRQGGSATAQFKKMIGDNVWSLISGTRASMQVISYTQAPVLRENTNGSVVGGADGLNGLVAGIATGDGTADEVAALEKAVDTVSDIDNENPTIVFWVLGDHFGNENTVAVEDALQSLDDALGANDALIAWQLADKPNNLITDHATSYTTAENENTSAAYADSDAEKFRSGMLDSLERVLHDHYRDTSVTLSLTDGQSLATKITDAEWKPANENILPKVTTEVATDGKSVTVNLDKLCDQISGDLVLTLDLDTNINKKETVLAAATAKGYYSGLFDEKTENEPTLSFPAVDIDRSLYTISFVKGEAEGTAPEEITAMPGQFVTIPDGSELSNSGSSFGGWNVKDSDIFYSAGQIIAMPAKNLTLTPAWGHVEVELELGQVNYAEANGNQMSPNAKAGKGKLLNFVDVQLNSDEIVAIDAIHSVQVVDDAVPYNTTPSQEDPNKIEITDPELKDTVLYARHVGATADDAVVAYLKQCDCEGGDTEKYDLIIAGPGGVVAPADMYDWMSAWGDVWTDFVERMDLSALDTSQVTNMSSMFYNCQNLTTLDLSNFDTTKVEKATSMFEWSTRLTEITFGEKCTFENATDLGAMFNNCQSVKKLDVSSFNTENVKSMNAMFQTCPKLEKIIFSDNFNTSNVTKMANMFLNCSGLNSLDISHFDTSNVTNMGTMFAYCSGLTSLNLTNFNTSKVTKMSCMFEGCSGLTSLTLSESFDTSNVTDMSQMFWKCSKLTNLTLPESFNTSNVVNMSRMFQACSSLTDLTLPKAFDTSKVENMREMFADNTKLETVDLSQANFNTSRVTTMQYLFSDDSALRKVNLGDSFYLQNVQNLSATFSGCSNLETIDGDLIFSAAMDNQAQNLSSMFSNCGKLEEVNFVYVDSGGNEVENRTTVSFPYLTTMASMFSGCKNLTSIDMGGWQMQDLTNTSSMFNGCSLLGTLDLSWTGINAIQGDLKVDGMFNSVPANATLTVIKEGNGNLSTFMRAVVGAFKSVDGRTVNEKDASSDTGSGDNTASGDATNALPPTEPEPSPTPQPEKPSDGSTNDNTSDESTSDDPTKNDATTGGDASSSTAPGGETMTDDPEQDATEPAADAVSPLALSRSGSTPVVQADDGEKNYTVNGNIWTHNKATPAGSEFQYRVRVKYVGDVGAQSGEIKVTFPIPDDVRVLTEAELNEIGAGTKLVQAGSVKETDGADSGDFMGGRVVDAKYDSATETLTATIDGLFTGTEVEISIWCENETKVFPQGGGYVYWDGTATAQDSAAAATSNVYRLWDVKNVTPTPPEAQDYTLTYKFTGDVPPDAKLPQGGTYEENAPVNVAAEPSTNYDYYEFEGWKDENGKSYAAGESITMNQNITLTGNWTRNEAQAPKVTVKYQYDNTAPKDAPTIPDKTISVGDTYAVVGALPDTGYASFNGWVPSLSVGDSNVAITDDDKDGIYTSADYRIPISGTLSTEQFCDKENVVVTYTGSWTPYTGTIKFNANADGVEGLMTDMTDITHDTQETLTPNAFTREGYTFAGWSLSEDGPVVKSDGDSAAGLITQNGQEVTLYAQWQEKPAVVETIKVYPADIIIYMGGADGAAGTVNENGDIVGSDSLPEPGFRVTLPASLKGTDVTTLTFKEKNGTKTWKFVPYDGESSTVYKLVPQGEGQAATRVQFTKANGEVITSDNFTVGKEVNTSFEMGLYKGGVGEIVVKNGSQTYSVNSNFTGTLTVRGATADVDYAALNATVAAGEPGLTAAANTTYTINNGDVQADKAGIALLFDAIINTTDNDRTAQLEDCADKALGGADADRQYEIRYLDLVDRNNGNAWVKASENVTVSWPLPAGTDADTDFTLLHFKDLHRDMESGVIEDNIETSEVEEVTCKVEDGHVVFEIGSGGFSPFALVWDEEADEPNTPDKPNVPTEPDMPEDLNTVDHFSYIVGYEDGTVMPQKQITRAEVATIFYRLLKEDVRDENTTDVSDFSDVSSSDWYGTTVATLADMGILKGYEDGTFRPNAPISRAEFAVIATRFFEETGATYEPGTFTDVTGSEWFAGAIMDAVNLGLIGGYEDGTVRPNNNITRAEACAIVNRTLGRVPDADHLLPEDEMKTWPDNPESAWFYADMQEATNGHEYEWITEDGNKVENWTDLLDKDWNDR